MTPTSGRVLVAPDGRQGAAIGTVAGMGGTVIEVLLDDGTTVAVSASMLARPPRLSADPAIYTVSIAAGVRVTTQMGVGGREVPLSEYLDALSGMRAYRQQVD